MAITVDQERVKSLLMETITMLCKNGLHYDQELTIEGLIGITIDKNSVVLINIKETVKNNSFNQSNNEKLINESLKTKRKKSHIVENNLLDTLYYEPPIKMQQIDNLNNPLDNSQIINTNSEKLYPEKNYFEKKFIEKNYQSHNITQENQFFNKNLQDKDNYGLTQSQTIASLEGSTSLQYTNNGDISDCSDQEFSLPIKDEYIINKEAKDSETFTFQSNNRLLVPDQNSGLIDNSIVQLCSDLSSNTYRSWQNVQHRPHNPVEMLPGSGVYINADTYEMFLRQSDVSASRLVRKVVREVFPDLILASSCCLGTGQSHAGLDHYKVKTIKAFVQQRIPGMSHTEIVSVINECCRDIRAKFRRHLTRNKERKIERTQSDEIVIQSSDLKIEPEEKIYI